MATLVSMTVVICLILNPVRAAAADAAPDSLSAADIAGMSIEELANIEVSSVSKHAERLSDAPASIFVITDEDIRRSGATSLPEALRLAPNLTVARVNANEYAISARGFNNAIGNKLLVLIDGRTVYTPLFSGVNWDAQNVMLEDVERVEVISGTGATLWGANAVNGVINVITRSAQDTQGGIVTVGTGKRESNGAMRYGGKIGKDGHFRVYGIGLNRKNTEHADGSPVPDNGQRNQAGFRADWGSAKHAITLQGDAYKGGTETGPLGFPTTIFGATSIAGANLLARWNRKFDDGSEAQVQTYLDHVERDNPSTLQDIIDTFDSEFQHSFTIAAKHKILWGGGYRYAVDNAQTHFIPQNPLPFEFIPNHRKLDWAKVFAQDEIALSQAVNLTLGLKAESNVYTGIEYLPSARLAWKPDTSQLIWGAVSRAVRAPARLDRDFNLYLYIPSLSIKAPVIIGGPAFQSEVANVIEIGYRAQPSDVVSYSITVHRSFYDKLRSGQPPPAVIQNMMYGTTSGIEAWGSYQATQIWRLSGGLTVLRERFALYPGSLDSDGFTDLGNDPANTWMLRSTLNLTSRHDFDVTVRHVSALPSPAVPQYTAVDAGLAWRPKSKVELSLTAQNLFVPAHAEFGNPASEVNRGIYGKGLWEF